MNNLEKTIFAIEEIDGERKIHFFGYGYHSDGSDDEKNYCFLEYTHFYANVDDVLGFISSNTNGFSGYEMVYSERCKQYITDCSYEEVIDIINHYDSGKAPKEIKESDIKTADCGVYILVEDEKPTTKIRFDEHWNKSTIKSIVKNNSCYVDFHKDLKALCISYDDGSADYEELAFAVPRDWLEAFCKENFNVEDLDRFLEEEYTNRHSIPVFEAALSEKNIMFVSFS